jgi:hypothetical protein
VAGLGEPVTSGLTVWRSPPARRAVRTHWRDLDRGGRGRVQVLAIIVAGQDLHAVGQRGPQVGRVVGVDAAADPSRFVMPSDTRRKTRE